MRSVDEQYPHVASWVQDGWVEIGDTDYGGSFIRVLDIGGEDHVGYAEDGSSPSGR